MRLISLDEVRKLQLSLLKEFDEYCNSNGLTYYLYYGTLLGAVRHKGMIPWDNDIDVAMPREDYDRLMELMKEEKDEQSFRFLCYENYPEYLWAHGRISIKNTFMKTAGMYALLGLSIDIFPLDNQGDDEEEATNLLKEIKRCATLRVMSYLYKYKNQLPKEDNPLTEIFNSIGDKQEKFWLEKEIALSTKYRKDGERTKYFGSNADGAGVCNWDKREWFDGTVLLDFEGGKFPAPSGWHEILVMHYKDYMQLPPIEQRNKVNNMQIFELTDEEMQSALREKYFKF